MEVKVRDWNGDILAEKRIWTEYFEQLLMLMKGEAEISTMEEGGEVPDAIIGMKSGKSPAVGGVKVGNEVVAERMTRLACSCLQERGREMEECREDYVPLLTYN